ncbi:MAG: HEAT repeat domain-containing protein [Deltaproteobacteria bacterium]|nr:HEAT repeat domain-containing protein [Deltaproteobacteria bacterium]
MSIFGVSAEKVEKWTQDGNAKKLLGALKSDDAVIRRLAAEGLAKVGGEDVLAYCKKNAQDPDKNVRWHITQILAMMGTPEAVRILAEVKDPTSEWDERAKKMA